MKKDAIPGPSSSAPGFVPVSADPRPGQRGLAPALQVTLGTGQRCPFCRANLLSDEPLAACVACMTVSHAACVAEGRGACTTLGCPRVALAPPASPAPASWKVRGLAAAGLLAGAFAAGTLARTPSPADPIGALRPITIATTSFDEPFDRPRMVETVQPLRVAALYVVPLADGLTRVVVTVTGCAGRSIEGSVGGAPLEVVGRAWCGDRSCFATVQDLETLRDQVTLEATLSRITGDRFTAPLVVLAAGREALRQDVVFEAVALPGPWVDLEVPAEATQSTVVLRGVIASRSPQVRVTVVAPGGQELAWDAAPGPFESAITLPHPGRHEVRVIVRDALGRETITTRDVRW